MKAIVAAAALLAASLLGGCATVTQGTSQDIVIDAEPQGAECKVNRRGVLHATVIVPGKANVPRGGDTLEVTCSAQGFESGTQHVAPTFSGATIGNVLLGGLIGIAIDAASGANHAYPPRISMLLTPIAFDSEQSRDIHFQGAAARIRARSDDEVKLQRTHCGATQRELCDIKVKEIEEGRDQLLVQLESKRQAARIAPGGATVAAAAPQRLPPAPVAAATPTVPSTPPGSTNNHLHPIARVEQPSAAPTVATAPPSGAPASDRPLSADEGRLERERRILAEEKRLMEDRQRLVDAEKRVLEDERRAVEEKRREQERQRQAAETARVAALPPPPPPVTPTAQPTVRTAAVQRTQLPPGVDGGWRGTYTCDANSFAVPVALEVEMRVQGGKGRAVYATSGAQTHWLVLTISGGVATFERASENANGRQVSSMLKGPVVGDAISFTATESAGNTGAWMGNSNFHHCTVSLQRGL